MCLVSGAQQKIKFSAVSSNYVDRECAGNVYIAYDMHVVEVCQR
jgi:hypothetical protein